PQPTVFAGVLSLLDNALAQFQESGSSSSKISDYDLIYSGDIAKWKKLAMSVKLRTLMTMVDKDPSKATAIGQLISAGGFISAASENAKVSYENRAGRYNPKYGLNRQYNSGQSFFGASKWVLNFLNPLNDPRIPIFFEKPASASAYVAPEPGQDIVDTVHSKINRNFHKADQPEILFTYQEQLFFEAEVYARGLGVTTDMNKANTLYKKAVEESAKYYGVAASAAATYANSLPDLNSLGSNRAAVKYIHYHHWVDVWDRATEAFTQWRRSGPEGDEVPPLTLPTGAPAGGLFRRYEYPINNEIAANPNAPKDKIKYNAKMWFDL
ncbi:MAG: SusD/RagB family nutrient-binding outer membrane lipoprotein, partial [Flavisolibacter sp.]|nr:SusD/RagB family nutrient-binding outer membrane lipoprotein [Flavisolibacter sp.]